MRCWDASALVPLIVREPGTKAARQWLAEDAHIVTWAWSRVEITSSVERRARQELITPAARRTVLRRFASLWEAWDEVTDLSAVRTLAQRLLSRHALRAADAGQLASALIAAEGTAESMTFVCLDRDLTIAADREGLRVLYWPEDLLD